jgi:transposase
MLMEKITTPFYLVLDNSKPHMSKEIKEWASKLEDKILLFLPPYSPYLNKIERVWKLTRKTTTHNKYYATLDHIKKALKNQFKQWKKPDQILKTLCKN